MSVTEPGPINSASLVARVQGILLHPKAEWEIIDVETATVQGLFTGYAMILAAIPALAQFVGSLFPICVFGICVHVNLVSALIGAIVYYIASLAGIYITALIVDALAPNFGGEKNQIQSLKLVVYAWTAAWLAGIFAVFPVLAPLSILGLYSIYLLYLGLPRLMKSPEDKSLVYTAVALVIAAVVMAVIFGLTGAVTRMGMPVSISSLGGGHVSGQLNVGGASVDLGKVDAAAKQMQTAAAQMQAAQTGAAAPTGAVKAVPADTLKALLPASLPAGFTRTEISADSASAAGMGGTHVQGVYAKGDGQITLEVTDLAAMGALAALGGAVNVESSHETATGYEKVGKVDGRLTTEEFDSQSHSGKYSVVVADRFVVEANGSGVDINALKGAVGSIAFDRLTDLAHSA